MYSRIVSKNEIVENDYNLNLIKYVDTSLPEQKFDTNALLNGGVPKTEVEDEVFQKLLKKIDISSIFDIKDKDYFVFKPKIKSKAHLLELLKTVDKTVVKKFELLWDTYHQSLHEIKIEVKKSEEKISEILKKIGYE